MSDLVVLFNRLTPRLEGVLAHALSGRVHRLLSLNRLAETDIRGSKVVFALCVGEYGLDSDIVKLLLHLRKHPDCMDNCVAVMLIDGTVELYTKHLAQMFTACRKLRRLFLPREALSRGYGLTG